jgi:hypothetical protein
VPYFGFPKKIGMFTRLLVMKIQLTSETNKRLCESGQI